MTLGDVVFIGLVCGAVGALAVFFKNVGVREVRRDTQFVAPLETERRFRIVQGGRQ